MEQRMARMEAMMEALVQDRGLHFTPSGSLEREQSVGHRSESAFSMPILDPIHPALDQMVQQSPEQQQQLALGTDPAQRPDATVLVRIGNQDQTLPFPEDFTHVMYVSNFFGDIHLRHPCIDETDFFARTGRILTNGALETTDVHFLALSYVIFACSQAVNHRPHLHGTGPDESPGWRWYLLADSIVDKKALLSGCNDLTLIQYLLFQVGRLRSVFNHKLMQLVAILCVRGHASFGLRRYSHNLHRSIAAEFAPAVNMEPYGG